MRRTARLILLPIAIGLAVLATALGIAWIKLVPSDEQLAQQLVAQAQARLGVEVKLGSAQLTLWPRPEFVVEDAQTVQPQPIRIKRLVAHADLLPLLHGRMELDEVLVEGAVLPQLSLRALRLRPAPGGNGVGDGKGGDALQLARLDFRDVAWISRHGLQLEFSGSAQFGPGWQLREAEVVRPGAAPAARIALTALDTGRWKVDSRVGGGSANGEVTLKTAADGSLALTGELAPRGIDIAGGLASFKRHSALQGKASGHTTLTASGRTIGELARSLHTRTQFTVAAPTLLHIDVDKAIRSFGQDRAGQTALLSLAGQMDTQNTADGMVVRYTGLQARGQTFSASGQGTIANRQVSGEMKVDLAGGLVGVPLRVSGPLAQPQVSVAAGALAGAATGAAIGTVLLPGVGTALGATVGKLLGPDDPAKKPASVH